MIFHLKKLLKKSWHNRKKSTDEMVLFHTVTNRVRLLNDMGNLEVKPITQGQVLAALEYLNTNKATAYDNIPAKVLKIAANELAKPLTTLFNSCIRNCVWPRD